MKKMIVLLVALSLVGLTPFAAGQGPAEPRPDECNMPEDGAAQASDRACLTLSALPDGPHCAAAAAACGAETFYVFLNPFVEGNPESPVSKSLVWQEANGCEGLQTTVDPNNKVCGDADTKLLV